MQTTGAHDHAPSERRSLSAVRLPGRRGVLYSPSPWEDDRLVVGPALYLSATSVIIEPCGIWDRILHGSYAALALLGGAHIVVPGGLRC
jgi:hypothetical protein